MSSVLTDEDIVLLNNIEEAEIEDDKVYFPFDSEIQYVLAFIFIFLSYFLVNREFNIFKEDIVKILIYAVPSFIIALLVLQFPRRVIDFKNKIIYYQYTFFFLFSIKINKISETDILKVCNNIIAQQIHPNNRSGFFKGEEDSEKHPVTNYFHNYYLSFFLKSGKLVDFLPLGFKNTGYKNSLLLAKLISKIWDKELISCPDDKNIVVDNNDLKISNIEKTRDSIFILLIIVAFIVIMIIMFLFKGI
ncbi:MAG: hypothetical protein J6Z11_08215 [Candidatus Riflebacteria bacterium]|nr:hypothetical protein [Candidatus Riflebacteria bacterium]